MSKNKTKHSGAKPHNPKSKKSKKPLVIILAAVLSAVLAIAVYFVLSSNSAETQLSSNFWAAEQAHNASGDEVELAEVYETNYTSYRGSVTFNTDGTFEFWLSPGNPEDGTHSGAYTVKDESTITATFDNGEQTEFKLTRKDGKITAVTATYNTYTVTFTNDTTQ